MLAFYFYKQVEAESPGDERMVYLMNEIRTGARAFLKKEYTWVAVFVVAMMLLLALVIDPLASVTYLLGAVLSAGAGYAGMNVATIANARTAEAAKSGPGKALPVAFRGGAVVGFSVAGLALLGLALTYLVFVVWMEVDEAFEIFTAYGLGASSIALFARVGGGIYTKAADVGADLVGKVEAGIPEDDPRNPATIADNVGDNVGDVAGMGADLFESYAGSIIAPVSLTAFALAITTEQAGDDFVLSLLMFPFAIAFIGMVASIIGSFFVKGGDSTESHALSRALHMGTNVAMALTALASVGAAYWLFSDSEFFDNPIGLAISVIGGLIVGWALGKCAEYYTSDQYGPVKKIAKQAETGPATTILGGISTGMVSVALSVRADPRRRRDRLLGRADHLRCRVRRLRRDLRHRGGGHRHARHDRHRRVGRRVRADLRQRRRHRRDGRTRPVGPRGHRRARLARQHHRGDREGFRRRLGGTHRAGAVQELRVRDCRRRPVGGPRSQRRQGRGVHRAVPRRRAAVPVRRPDDRRGRTGRTEDDRGSATPVPRDPGTARGSSRGGARLGSLRRHLDRGLAAGDDRARARWRSWCRSSSASSASTRSVGCSPVRS